MKAISKRLGTCHCTVPELGKKYVSTRVELDPELREFRALPTVWVNEGQCLLGAVGGGRQRQGLLMGGATDSRGCAVQDCPSVGPVSFMEGLYLFRWKSEAGL